MPQYPRKNRDPQLILEGQFKQTDRSDIIVFEIPWGPITLACIVTVPDEGKDKAPVYVKIRNGRGQHAGRGPRPGNHRGAPPSNRDPADIRYEVEAHAHDEA